MKVCINLKSRCKYIIIINGANVFNVNSKHIFNKLDNNNGLSSRVDI